ncbi:UbiD family decarboxylase [Tuwongella immobilis]|uniref:Uncharacterized protein n=1 Tax=Tuwongella immobilis TaxID=692036 RepID=A0A6C2YQF4_9BACT|nr:UbiD family decarboxylase [Tuwongella immobilis]VIP03870.1 3-octaprenyl-4-hydroxybenzoate carboxy-lyase : UbiD family decarboxylase OS=Planctomyces limnophilus (strain ATCC 43296 / DSM 3776 / IFAM 1008 / 290) GN=Plim_4242 PE=4 SV=1: UbiD [Tuwongella immobilis]VTS05107.1 3-octaprenyl-4-hydroxybenzoate carboxy-lyase : UbiD family decarboxylase OS=Planctomyces limnophilus (strain ATCC 43296 / DSM 3776 / IFAM 1008 / 290) GN=Plim_4242 PE=4 SV=1: UbiD [Tuwongella immobilis]
MGYRTLRAALEDLERTGQLRRIDVEIDPNLEMAEIHRRIYQAGGPALWFTRVKGCHFSMASNIYGTIERTRFLFRDTIEAVKKLVELKIDPGNFARRPWRYLGSPFAGLNALPKFVSSGPILDHETTLSQLPQLKCWPMDGGAFVTLPQVYSEDPDAPGWRKSNLGMYRVQISGNEFVPDREIGMHYQIHRGIGVHHTAALRRNEALPVHVWVGGPPVMPLAAVMPLPEGLPELAFAGALGGRRVRMVRSRRPDGSLGLPMPAEADFVITGTIQPGETKPEGPFGDHLGYYSLTHPFPLVRVERVYHRKDAIWPFTVVGRPPQEDTAFGEIIHELTGPVIPTVVPGIHAVHAVDAAGVHPLLLAIGSERYVPYASKRTPQELLTCANAVLGQGQLSLAKYLLIIAHQDAPNLDIHDIPAFFRHLLERIDPTRDLHFQTRTTIDTLDYTGDGLNQGSKVVIAAAGEARRTLPTTVPSGLRFPEGFGTPHVALPGVLTVTGPTFRDYPRGYADVQRFADTYSPDEAINQFPLILLCDDSEFSARTLNNFLWTAFTRSNPAADISGIGSFTEQKHWGCRGSIIIDARRKPQHAPPLIEDSEVNKRVDALAAPGGPLHGLY